MLRRVRQRDLPDWTTQSGNWSYQTRQRWIPYSGPPYEWGAWSTNLLNKRIAVTVPGSLGRQFTADEVHPSFRRGKTSALDGDVGGEFTSRSSGVTTTRGGRHAQGMDSGLNKGMYQTEARYFGPWYAIDPNMNVPGYIYSSDSRLNELGTTAIARCKPTNSVASVATSVGELFREGLPKLFGATLWKDKTALAKSGDEYLNSEFGWKPIVSDIKDVAYAAANADSILSHYERNAGQVVRRRYEFPIESTSSDVLVGPSNGWTNSGGWYSPGLTDTSRPMPNLRCTTRTFRRVWFSGAFTYHLPSGYNSRNGLVSAAAKAGPLLGIELTPEVIWNLTPWSWAIDWFSNAGDVVSNLSDWATDGLVMKYGYIMEHTRHEKTYYLDGRSQWKFIDRPYPGTVTAWSETKLRRAASPFGFGVSWNGMTPRQLAITAALGITRVFR